MSDKDTIYREDVLRIIDRKTVRGKLQVAREVLKLPSTDVRPVVHGEWIKTMEGNAFRDKCSECESLYPNAHGYNYCPNCGAKMDGKGADNGTNKG